MALSNAFGVQCKICLCTAENWQTFKRAQYGLRARPLDAAGRKFSGGCEHGRTRKWAT